MKVYADDPARRTRQVLGDLLLAAWVVLWVTVALVVREATLALAGPGRLLADAGGSLRERLRDAGAAVGHVPLVGDQARAPFSGAGNAAQRIADAGNAQVELVAHLAFWLGLAVGAVPILVALAAYLPLRWRFVREASAGQRFLESGGDLDLFALRALATQPMHRLARISDDPAGAWRAGDPEVVGRLAALELRNAGLTGPRRR